MFLLCAPAWAYVQNSSIKLRTPTLLSAKKKKKTPNARGFGKLSNQNSDPMEKTYDLPPVEPIDEDASIEDFFKAHTEWHPLFSSIATSDDVPASTHIDLKGENESIIFDDEKPWVKLPQKPEDEDLIETIALVLDNFQKALTDIPVSEELYSRDAEDNNDMHFLEEGRRLLVLQRFQVIVSAGADNQDLFRTCWSEIHHLITEGGGDIGSLIILEEEDEDFDLGNFVDNKIRLPLQSLGLGDMFEVSGFVRGKQCVRLIQNLGDIRSLEERDAEIDRAIEGFQ